jgi:RES domain
MLSYEQLQGMGPPVDAATKQEVVWAEIDYAFSRPVSRSDESIEYVPTQILAEAFLSAGYEAIAYGSYFGDPGYNVVLFDINDVEIGNSAPYAVRKLVIEFERIGGPLFPDNQ